MKFIVFILLIANLIFANTQYDDYFIESGKMFAIPPILLKKIATIESDLNPNCITNNTNKTTDYGLMQINSCHFKELDSVGIKKEDIMNPRVNILAGAYLLSKYINLYGFNLESIGRYHSNTQSFKAKWNSKLVKELSGSFN